VLLGPAHEEELELADALVVALDQREVEGDGRLGARFLEAGSDAFPVTLVGNPAGRGEAVLVVGVLDVGQQAGAPARQYSSPSFSSLGRMTMWQ